MVEVDLEQDESLLVRVLIAILTIVHLFFRCREKQRKEASRLQAVNRKLTAMNKLLMEENDRLQKQVSQLVYENGYFRQHTQSVSLNSTLFSPFSIHGVP